MKLEARIFCAQRPQQIFVPLDAKVRMQPALHQYACAAEGDCLVDFVADLVDGSDVGVRGAGPAVESAKCAHDVTDVRVVYVSIDDVRYDIVPMAALAHFVCSRAYAGNVVRLKERGAIFSA